MADPNSTLIHMIETLQTAIDALAVMLSAVNQKMDTTSNAQASLQQLVSDVQATLLHVQDVIGSP